MTELSKVYLISCEHLDKLAGFNLSAKIIQENDFRFNNGEIYDLSWEENEELRRKLDKLNIPTDLPCYLHIFW